MDALKAMLKAKKEEQAAEFGGKKFIKRAELEEQRLKRLREEEETERTAKVHHCPSSGSVVLPLLLVHAAGTVLKCFCREQGGGMTPVCSICPH